MELFAPQKQSHRHSKLEHRIFQFICELIVKKDMPPCFLDGGAMLSVDSFITVTKVHLTSDGKLASIYFRHFDDKKNNDVLSYFKKMSGFFRGTFSRTINTKFVPEFRFFLDEAYDKEKRVQTLIGKIREDVC